MASVFDGLPDVFTGALGQTVTVIPAGGVAEEITAIYRRSGMVDPLGEFGVVTHEARLSVGSATVAATPLAKGDLVEIDEDTRFTLGAPVKDAHGMTTFPLEKTA